MLLLRVLRRRQTCDQLSQKLDINMRSRLQRAFYWLVTLTALHTLAMVLFEGLGWEDSLWLTLTTMTTVGYGDIVPTTAAGQAVASLVMMIGYAIIAIPTGIVTAEIVAASRGPLTTRACPVCVSEGHSHDAVYCKDCGAPLQPRPEDEPQATEAAND